MQCSVVQLPHPSCQEDWNQFEGKKKRKLDLHSNTHFHSFFLHASLHPASLHDDATGETFLVSVSPWLGSAYLHGCNSVTNMLRGSWNLFLLFSSLASVSALWSKHLRARKHCWSAPRLAYAWWERVERWAWKPVTLRKRGNNFQSCRYPQSCLGMLSLVLSSAPSVSPRCCC